MIIITKRIQNMKVADIDEENKINGTHQPTLQIREFAPEWNASYFAPSGILSVDIKE